MLKKYLVMLYFITIHRISIDTRCSFQLENVMKVIIKAIKTI